MQLSTATFLISSLAAFMPTAFADGQWLVSPTCQDSLTQSARENENKAYRALRKWCTEDNGRLQSHEVIEFLEGVSSLINPLLLKPIS